MKEIDRNYNIYGKKLDCNDRFKHIEIDQELYKFINFNKSISVEVSSTRSFSDNVPLQNLKQFDLISVEYEDGGVWFFTNEEYRAYIKNSTSTNRGNNNELTINPVLKTNNRGGGILEKFIDFIATNKVSSKGIKLVVEKIEDFIVNKTTGLFHIDEKKKGYIGKPFEAIPYNNKYLLLLHGTNSSIEGSFSGIIASSEWEEIKNKYDGNIIGFQHRTMSEPVLKNAVEIYKHLPQNAEIDILCFSRGALIAECLNILIEETFVDPIVEQRYPTIKYLGDYGSENNIELPKDLFKQGLTIGSITRVAGAAAGTSLLGNKIPDYLQTLFNLGKKSEILSSNKFYILFRILISVLVKQKDNELTMPGIKNMTPGDDLLRILNNSEPFTTPMYSIQGVASADNLPRSIAAILADWIHEYSNDWVIDTVSMNQGLHRNSFYYKLFSNLNNLNHFQYFNNSVTRNKIFESLTIRDKTLLNTLFDELSYEEQTRGTFIKQGGEVSTEHIKDSELKGKEVIVLIPGILGSTLSIDDELWWVNMARLFKIGALDKIDITKVEGQKAKATGGIGNAYECFYEEFTAKGYNVLLFPFDWRKSVKEEGTRFIKRIEDLEKLGLKIHIMAHSMGGLIARELMMRNRGLQQKLIAKGGKIMLLGVPWMGSYLILETFNSTGKRFKQLHALTKMSARTSKDLLEVIHHFKGLWDLLPIYGKRDFSKNKFWEDFYEAHPKKALDPSKKEFKKYLAEFGTYRKDIRKEIKKLNYENVYYIAGYSKTTTNNYYLRDNGIRFLPDYEGDGSVTWSSGIPAKLSNDRTYYVDVKHGDLCNQEILFNGYENILKNGEPSSEEVFRPSKEKLLPNRYRGLPIIQHHALSNRPEAILANLFDQSINDPYKREKEYSKLTVEILNGHLKYSKYPLMVGHFYGDDIVSAENVVNFLYDNELSQRNDLGVYPSHLGTSLFVNSKKTSLRGALIVGLGTRSSMNAQRLQYTIEQSALSFLLNKEIEDKSGISSIIIGSGFGDLILTECVNAIITGVANANERYSEIFPNLPTISNLVLVELYKDKAEQIYEYINENKSTYKEMNVFLHDELKQVQGFVEHRKYQSDQRWWYNITVNQHFENGEPVDKFDYSVSSKIARVDSTTLSVDKEETDLLLGKINSQAEWRKETVQAAFRMLIPKEIIRLISSNTGIVWILDKYTAVYPWELIFMDKLQDKPTSVQAGMIRQLVIDNPKPVKYVNANKICVIADPILSNNDSEFLKTELKVEKFAQLPNAAKEGKYVIKKFEAFKCETTDLVEKTFAEIYPKLILEKHRLLHIACHGVVDWGPKNKTGIVFDYKSIFTAEKLSNLEYMPDFVFLNCCYSGYISNTDKNKFSANVGISLIENGVKAVIVGAWDIDDRLAMEFADKFYTNFLNGDYFGEAVRKARELIYNSNKENNTWAAYQCYGNQYYTFKLNKKNTGGVISKNYKLKKDIYQDLEGINNRSSSARKRNPNILDELIEIKNTIYNNKLADGKMLEKLALLFAENGDYENAIGIYEEMNQKGKLDFSLWSQNFHKVIRAKHIVQLSRKIQIGDKKEWEKGEWEKKETYLKNLERLKKEAESIYQDVNSKNNIVMYTSIIKSYLICYEDFHKTKMPITKKQKDIFKKHLELISELYLEAYDIAKSESNEKDTHTLCAGIYSLSTHKESIPAIKKTIHDRIEIKDIDIYLNELLQDIKEEQNKGSWDLIKPINIYEAQLLLADGENKVTINEIVETIKSKYTDFWSGGGAKRNVMAEIDQIDFLLASNKVMNTLSKNKLDALEELKLFYDDLIK